MDPPRTSSAPPPDAPASVVIDGKYRLGRVLGKGGMGAVYEAEHVGFGKRVALKLIDPKLHASREAAERFRREARAASVVESEHIVQVFDVGEDPERGLYMVMELLSGEELAARLAREGHLSPELTATIGHQAATALGAAHAAGVVHRDLKPANLFLTTRSDGSTNVKILDFGISKLALKDRGQGADAGRADALTQSGTLLGTPQYMSPEQAQGLEVDARADVWSLGAVLYEALSGRPAFASTLTHEQMIVKVVTTKPAKLDEIAPWAPADLAAAIHGALTHDLDQRTPSAARFAEELAPFAAARAGSASARPPALSVAATNGLSSRAASLPPFVGEAKPTLGPTTVDTPARRSSRPVAFAVLGVLGLVGAALVWRALYARPPASTGAPVVIGVTAPPVTSVELAPPSDATAPLITPATAPLEPTASASATAPVAPAAPIAPTAARRVGPRPANPTPKPDSAVGHVKAYE